MVTVLGRHGFRDFLDRLRARYYVTRQETASRGLSTAERMRLVFEELGPTYIKLAQILSSRPDILPPEYIQEFSKLQDQVPPFPFTEAKKIIETELRYPICQLFTSIEETSVAAASLAQVHRARTISGDEIAIKIQRPRIGEIIETDMRILREFANLAEKHIPESKYFEPVRLVDEFARSIRHELDFMREGHNIERFRSYFLDSSYIYIPDVYWDLTTPKVLTTEFIDGIKISDLDRLDREGLDRKTIALNGANLTLREIFEFHFFHADPHPGNIFVLRNNVIAPVDFGMTGFIDEETAGHISSIFVAVVQKDVDMLVSKLQKIGLAEELEHDSNFKSDLWDLVERYYGIPLKRLHMGQITKEVMAVIRQYKLHLPANFAMMARALLISEGVGQMLYPDFNIIETARPYAKKLMMRRYNPIRHFHELSDLATETFAFLKVLPTEMREILLMIRKGKVAVGFEHRGLGDFL